MPKPVACHECCNDAGVSAGLRARELYPGCQVAGALADRYPNYSICGLPFCPTGERETSLLLEAQMIGRRQAEVARRIDVFVTAPFHNKRVDELNDLDLSYTPPVSALGPGADERSGVGEVAGA